MAFNAAIGTLSVKISADTSDVRRAIKNTNKQLSKSGKALKRNEQDWKKWGAATKLVVTGVAILATRELIRYSDALTSMTNKLKLSTNSTKELAAITKTLFDVSKDTRTSVESTVDLYAKMERATRNLDISQQRLVKITSSINKAFAISGATAQETRGSIRQLGQALASGALRGDEFNSIAEQAPIIMEAVREATGKTAGELRELAATGAITAEILIESLERYANKIDSDFAQATATFGQKLEVARNNAIEFVGANDAITDSVAVFGDAVLILSENLDVLIKTIGFVAVVLGAKFIGPLIATRAALIGTRVAALATAGGFVTMAGAATAARTALAFLGGPVGAVILVASALFAFTDIAETTAEKTKKLADEVDNLALSFQGLTDKQRFVKIQNNTSKLSKLNDELTSTVTSLATAYGITAGEAIPSGTLAIINQNEQVKNLIKSMGELEIANEALVSGNILQDVKSTGEEGTGERVGDDGKALIDLDAKAAEARLKAAGDAIDRMFDQEEEAAVRGQIADEQRAEALKAQKLKQAEDNLAALNQQLLSEQELEKFFHQQDLAIAQEAFEQDLISETERDAIIESAERQHQETLTDIQRMEQRARSAALAMAFDDAATILATGGKKTLAIVKAASIASATIKGNEAAVDAWEFGMKTGGPVVAGIMATASAITTAAMIRNIAKSGSTNISASGGGGAAGGAQPAQQAPAQQVNRTIDVRFIGQGVMTQDQIRMLIEQFNEALGDGAQLNVVGG